MFLEPTSIISELIIVGNDFLVTKSSSKFLVS